MTTAELEEPNLLLSEKQTFSSDVIRLFVGGIAFLLPLIVSGLGFNQLSSISASYHVPLARDAFVGLLFMLGFCLFAYRGYSWTENIIATLGGMTALIAAIVPTACDGCSIDSTSIVHMLAGLSLFTVTAYFCFFPFYNRASKKDWDIARLRAKSYRFLGAIITIILVVLIFVGALAFLKKITTIPSMVFWGEFVMLWLFAFAWIIAAKIVPGFVDNEMDKPLVQLGEELGILDLLRGLKLYSKPKENIAAFLITYDLNKSDKDCVGIVETIKEYPYAQLSKSSYVIETKETILTIYEKLEKHLDKDDYLYVITLTSNTRKGYADSETIQWMKKHLPQ